MEGNNPFKGCTSKGPTVFVLTPTHSYESFVASSSNTNMHIVLLASGRSQGQGCLALYLRVDLVTQQHEFAMLNHIN